MAAEEGAIPASISAAVRALNDERQCLYGGRTTVNTAPRELPSNKS